MRTAIPGTLLLLVLMAAGCHAQPYRFDMGGPDTPLAPGFTRVTHKDLAAPDKPFGWVKPPMRALYRSEPTNPFFGLGPQSFEFAVLSDAVLSIEENDFAFAVTPGRYKVTVIFGDLALGEGRPGQSLWANGTLIADKVSTDASVLAYTFPVDAPEGKITLRFRSDSSQKYVTVEGVMAEPLPAGQALAVTMKQYPEGPVPLDTYRANWRHVQDLLVADWEKAKQELAAEGVDLAYTQRQRETLKQQPGYREYWGWSLGGGPLDRLMRLVGDLDSTPQLRAFAEMGIDGFGSNSLPVARQLRALGFKHAVSGSAENFPGDVSKVTLNLMKNADGSTTTVPKVWSNMAPEVHATFGEVWSRYPGEAAVGAEFFIIDEPRGMWGAGRFGDYSAPAQEAFQKWVAAQGHAELVGKPIPERGRTMAFYRFYQFRLNSVPIFMNESCQGTPLEKVYKIPGNGDVGPEQMNHNNVWPPAYAKAGMGTACWSYGTPDQAKLHAETIRMAAEHGGKSVAVPPQWPEMHTLAQDQTMNTAMESSLPTLVMPWHFNGPTNGPDRVGRMKNVFYSARLTHATSGLTHTPPLYVWLPDSAAYNDLVELNSAERENWVKVGKTLFDANLDYAVTNTLALPANSLVLWSCAKPVVNAEEAAALERFIKNGGVLLTTFADRPELPDGTPLAVWASFPQSHVVRCSLSADVLASTLPLLQKAMNLSGVPAAVKTYRYTRGGKVVHLLNNTDFEKPAEVSLPVAMTELCTGKKIPVGGKLTLPPGLYALLEVN